MQRTAAFHDRRRAACGAGVVDGGTASEAPGVPRHRRGYVAAMRAPNRLAYETDTINRAMQHDLVLFGQPTRNSGLVFRWRSGRETLGAQFDDRALAIDWI